MTADHMAKFPLLLAAAASLSLLDVRAEGVSVTTSSAGAPATLTNPRTGQDVPVIRPFTSGAKHLVPGVLPVPRPPATLPRVFAPTKPRDRYTRFPWKTSITATVFWVGEQPSGNNPTPNCKSAWDQQWSHSFGGYDNPRQRDGYLPKGFTPGQNPFYIALPYNDISKTGTKASARAVIPWFAKRFYRSGRTVLKGQWVAIRKNDRICYAQWEDVGPFETDDWQYVFGDSRPKAKENKSAGIDVSPAIRDYLGFGGGYGTCDWRFVSIDEVPDGPWKKWGANNPFANSTFTKAEERTESEGIVKVKELRQRLLAANTESEPSVE